MIKTNTIIEEYRKQMNTEVEPNRTRPFVKFICFHCKEEKEQAKANYRDNKPCKECNKRLRGKQNFLKRAVEKFGNKFDLTKAEEEYFDALTPVTIKCNLHEIEYQMNPTIFVARSYPNQPHNGGCPECAVQATKDYLRKPIGHYLGFLKDRFPQFSVVSHGTAESNQERIILNCKIHGDFSTKLSQLVHKDTVHLCPGCSQDTHAWRTRMVRTDVPGLVYFVKFKSADMYKCGVTYKTVNDRLRGHLEDIEEVWTLPFDTLADAYFFEMHFFREYSHVRCEFPDTSFGGYTEFFNTIIDKPNKRFIEEILCRKEPKTGNPDH